MFSEWFKSSLEMHSLLNLHVMKSKEMTTMMNFERIHAMPWIRVVSNE